jgi:hypothetical protein
MKMKKGFALIAAVFVFLIMALMAIVATTYESSVAIMAIKNHSALASFYIANAGMEYYLDKLMDDDDWSSPPAQETKSFSGGYFSISASNPSKNQITVTMTGIFTAEGVSYKRIIRADLLRTPGGVAGYLTYPVYFGGGGPGDGYIANNVTINGDIYVDGDMEFVNTVTVNGDAIASGDISGNTSGVTGDVDEYAEEPEGWTPLDTSYYDSEIAIAATYPWTNPTYTTNMSGTYYIQGNLTIDGPLNVANNTKIVVANGIINLKDHVTVGDNVTIICSGDIYINDYVTIGSGCLIYSGTKILMQNEVDVGSDEPGGGSSFISPGEVSLNSTSDFYGFIYAGTVFNCMNMNNVVGNVVGGSIGQIQNNVTITLDTSVNDYENIPGIDSESQESSTEVTSWDELY